MIDPLAGKYSSWSTYNYAVNSPIRFLDPDGKSVGDYERRNDEWLHGYYVIGGAENLIVDSENSGTDGDERVGSPEKQEGSVEQEGTVKDKKAQTNVLDKAVPFGGVMFYDERGKLLYVSGQGSINKIYIIPDKNINAVRKEINEFKSYWDQKRPSIGGKYSDSNYFQNIANSYSNNSYDPFVINGNVLGQKNILWYTYAATAISVMGEGAVFGRRGIPIDRQYSVANYWKEQYTPKRFQPWW